MIPALTIGRAGSTGFPKKNISPLVGRPLCSYPMMAALQSKLVDKLYVSTDSPEIAEIGKNLGAEVLERPPELATTQALSQDAFKHGYEAIERLIAPDQVEMIVLLFCNGATITPGIIDEGITALRGDSSLDSAVTISRYNMFSPLRAHKVSNGLLEPFFPPEVFDNADCSRDSQGDVQFPDCSMFVVRPVCFDYSYGQPPFPWIGRKIHPLQQWGGLDIDYAWQTGQVEYWLREHGFSETQTPYDIT